MNLVFGYINIYEWFFIYKPIYGKHVFVCACNMIANAFALAWISTCVFVAKSDLVWLFIYIDRLMKMASAKCTLKTRSWNWLVRTLWLVGPLSCMKMKMIWAKVVMNSASKMEIQVLSLPTALLASQRSQHECRIVKERTCRKNQNQLPSSLIASDDIHHHFNIISKSIVCRGPTLFVSRVHRMFVYLDSGQFVCRCRFFLVGSPPDLSFIGARATENLSDNMRLWSSFFSHRHIEMKDLLARFHGSAHGNRASGG